MNRANRALWRVITAAILIVATSCVGDRAAQPTTAAQVTTAAAASADIRRDVYAYNHSRNARARWAVFGWDTRTAEAQGDIPRGAHVVKELPDGRVLCAAPIRAPPSYAGPVAIDTSFDYARPFYSASVLAGLPRFKPVVRIDGVEHAFVPHHDWLRHEHYQVSEWWCDVPATDQRREGWRVRLWTLLGRDDDVVPFWVSFFAENRHGSPHQSASLEIGLAQGIDIDMHTWFPTGTKMVRVTDGGAATYRGSFLFFAHAKGDAERVATLQAEKEWPFDVVAHWREWGIWRRPVEPWTDGEAEGERNLKYRAFADGRFADPMRLLHGISNMDPGNTGEQADFGCWHHLDTVSNPWGSITLAADRLAAARDLCRPTHFFEAGGVPFRASAHPKTIMWSERPDGRVSADVLGREDQEGLGWSGDVWHGYDREHHAVSWVTEDATLFLAPHVRFHLRQQVEAFVSGYTLPSTHPGHVRNGTGNARAVGRSFRAQAQIYFATGWREGIEHARKVCEEVEFRTWFGRASEGPIHAKYVTFNDAKTSIDGMGAPTWVTWQEPIYACGMDALAVAFRDAGWTAAAATARSIVRRVCRSIVLHAFFPDEWSSLPQISMYQRWRGEDRPLVGAEWRDPNLCTPSIPGTAFSTWARQALEIAANIDQDAEAEDLDVQAAARARELLARMGQAPTMFRRYGGSR
jgi:hypothetical protein